MKEDCTTCSYATILESDKVTCVEFPKRGAFSPEICHNYCPDEGRFSFNSFESFESEDEDTSKSNRIVLVSVDKLHPHPDNPRKELGDLTELAASIKESGIFQNLTAVPWFSSLTGKGCDDPDQQEEMGYIVIIGHRRLAAAKLAGLKEVPCAITEMDKKTQIATMLLENMQRSDLTVYEQAQGFQMMMDLGETMKDISEKTGFSETTVRRRVKLLDLDKDNFKESVERGATLMDFVELEKIKDIELKNRVLKSIGTSNFNYELQRAIDQEKKEAFNAKAIEFLNTFATEITDTKGMSFVKSMFSDKDLVKPEDADEVKYFYANSSNGYIYIYKEYQSQASSSSHVRPYEPDPKEQERRDHIDKLNEVNNRVQKLREDFINNLSYSTIKKNIAAVSTFILSAIYHDSYFDTDKLLDFLDVKEDEEIESFEDVKGRITEPEKILFLMVYKVADNNLKTFTWRCEYQENSELNSIYEILEIFGYEMSDEEKALRDGTHELFLSREVSEGA